MMPILLVRSKKRAVHSTRFNFDKGMTFKRLQDNPDTCLIWGALAFTLRISRFFGTAPSSFERARNCWRIGVSPAMCVYSYLFIIVLNIIMFTALARDASVPASDSIRMKTDINAAVWVVDLAIVTIISVYGIFSGPFQMKWLIVYFNHIHMILSYLKYEHIMQKPEKLRCCTVVIYLLGIIGICTADIASFIYDAMTCEETIATFWMYSLYYVEVVILGLLELQFFHCAMLSHTALQCVNEELSAVIVNVDLKTTLNYKSVTTLNNQMFSSRNLAINIPPCAVNIITDSVAMIDKCSYMDSASRTWNKKIRRLSHAFSAICDAVRWLDQSNGLLVLLLLFSFLIHLVVTPYYLITFIFRKRGEFMLQVFWSLVHITKLVMIVEPGHRIQQEIAKTQVLLSHLINRASSPRDAIMDELNIFYKQITLNPVAFSPLGICTLSRPLIASILGAVTTYLVILVQFQGS